MDHGRKRNQSFFYLVALVGLVMESLHYNNNIYASQSHAKFLLKQLISLQRFSSLRFNCVCVAQGRI